MKNLFAIANEYVRQSDWKELAMLKFCLFAMGIIAGMFVPSRNRKPYLITAIAVFVATYIPLMAKFFSVAFNMPYEEIDE